MAGNLAREQCCRKCTEVVADAVVTGGVALGLDERTKHRLSAMKEGTDTTFMLPDELLHLAPKTTKTAARNA